MLLAPLSNLEFPSWRAPGFDPTHPAAGPNVRFSAVAAQGGNFINLLTGKSGAPSGSPTYTTKGSIGPSTAMTTTSMSVTFSNSFSDTPAAATMAGIFIVAAVNVASGVFCTGTGTGSGRVALYINSGIISFYTNGVTYSSGIAALSTNTPYFVACSTTATTQVFVVVNLLTKVTKSATVSNSLTLSTPTTTYQLGLTSNNFSGYLAASMYSQQFTPLNQLLAWASDPWSFWYPDDDAGYRVVGLSGAGSLSFAGLSPSRFRAASAFAGAQSMAALGASIVCGRGAQRTGAFFSATGALRSLVAGRGSSALGSSISASSSGAARARVAQSLTSQASAASSAGARARTSPALAVLLTARTRASAATKGVFTFGAVLYSASALALASVRAEAVFVATVQAIVSAALLLKAPAPIRSLTAPARMRILKAISTIRNLKAPP